MGSATAGNSGVPGDPGALRGAAASFGGASGHLGGLAGDLTGATPGSWHGPASVACLALLRVLGHDLHTGADAFRHVAITLQRLAEAIETAQEQAAAALSAAAEADARATGLGQQALLEETPTPDAMITQLHDEAFGLRAVAAQAREDARTAGLAAAAIFAQAAGMAPQPPPPPAPPAHDDDDGGGGIGGFFKSAWNDVKSVPGAAKDAYDGANGWIDDRQDDMDGLVHGLTGHLPGPLESAANAAYAWSPMSPKFNIDFAQGVGDWGVGLVEATPMLIKLSPQYGMIDPEGQAKQVKQLGDGLSYAWDHPGQTAKAITGWQHVENGEPGRMAGEAAPDIVLTILSGGAAGAAKATRTTNALVDAAKLADSAKDVSKLHDLGKISYTERYPNELQNFVRSESTELTTPNQADRVIVNFGDSTREVGGRGRSVAWWTDANTAHGFGSVDDVKNGLALPDAWGGRDEVLISRIPAGQEGIRMEGPAAPQLEYPDPRPGGSHQILYQEVDGRHIVARLSADDFLRLRVPRFGVEDLAAPATGTAGAAIPAHQP